MKKSKKQLAVIVPMVALVTLSLTGCSSQGSVVQTATTSAGIATQQEAVSVTGSEMITQGGSYTYSGVLSEGITVNAPEQDVEIILNGVEIVSDSVSPIYVEEAKNVTITLAAGSENSVTDNRTTEEDVEDFPNAAIYSMSDLRIVGEQDAVLTVYGGLNDGITSKDDLEIIDATIDVTAKDDGIRGKDSATITGSDIKIAAGDDGIKSDNEEDDTRAVVTIADSVILIAAGDDGIHAEQVITIESGDVTITESYEGIEARQITINGGTISVTSDDDGINIAGDTTTGQNVGGRGGGESVLEGGLVTIAGGVVHLNTGGDGFDSNGNAVMTGGTLIIDGPTNNGNGPIDVNGTFDVSGGTVIAVGSAGMVETPSTTSEQLSLQINTDTQQSAGSQLTLYDTSGTEIFSYEPEKTFQSVTFSSADLVEGEVYALHINGEEYASVTLSGTVTTYGETGGMGGPQRGGRF